MSLQRFRKSMPAVTLHKRTQIQDQHLRLFLAQRECDSQSVQLWLCDFFLQTNLFGELKLMIQIMCCYFFSSVWSLLWWRHQRKIIRVTGGFHSQRPVTQSFDVFFVLCLTKRLSEQSRRRWFETPSRSLWRHCNTYVNNRDEELTDHKIFM